MRRSKEFLIVACAITLLPLSVYLGQNSHVTESNKMKAQQLLSQNKDYQKVKELDTIIYYPADSFIATGDVNGDGEEEVVFSGRHSANELRISNFHGFDAKITGIEGTYISSVNVVDLDGDGVGEIVVGQDNIEILPGMSPILHVYKWDGKGFQCIFRQENLDEVARIFKVKTGNKEMAIIYSTISKIGEASTQWVTGLIDDQKPTISFRQQVSGPVVFAGEWNQENIIITMQKKGGLGGLVMNYRDGALKQYSENPKAYSLMNDSISGITDFQIPYRGPIWGFEVGSFRERGRKEIVIGTKSNGNRELTFYGMENHSIKEIASITSSTSDNVIAGFVKVPGANSIEQIVSSDGDFIYYDGKAFRKKRVEFKYWDSVQNMAATKKGELYIIIRKRAKDNDYAGNLLQMLLK